MERNKQTHTINSTDLPAATSSHSHTGEAGSESSTKNAAGSSAQVGTVIFLTKESLGEGDVDFGKSLLNIFLQTMLESGHIPRAILLANSGVKIMRKDSPFQKVLQDFHKAGADVLACGLCVDYYKLKEDVPVEQITNMFAICEYLGAASKVISP